MTCCLPKKSWILYLQPPPPSIKDPLLSLQNLRCNSGLGEDVARRYFRQIVTAISYCHKLHVVHRDLKPENVVFFEKLGMVKLTDFGFSNSFDPGQRLLTSCGSLAYSAPEILLGDAYDAPAVGKLKGDMEIGLLRIENPVSISVQNYKKDWLINAWCSVLFLFV